MKIVRLSISMVLLFGLGYPLLMTSVSQLLFPQQADGSIVEDEKGTPIGSELIGQNFQSDRYFHGRISSIGYDAAGSGSLNYAPSNQEMITRTQQAADQYVAEHPGAKRKDVPLDLISNSGSGLDPEITPEAARFQIPRVAKARGVSEGKLESLIEQNTKGRSLGLFGEPRVNVLRLNMALDAISK